MSRAIRLLVVVGGMLLLAGGLSSCEVWSTIVVDTATDAVDATPGDGRCETSGGACTLRAAVQEANSLGAPTTIELADGETYTLSIAGPNEAMSATGDLDVTGTISIEGNGSTVDAAGLDRVVEVSGSGSLALRSVRVTGGSAMVGGGVRVHAGTTAQIQDSVIDGNEAWGYRQCGVAFTGFLGCSSETTAGGPLGGYIGTGGGAGIWNAGSLSVWRSTISANANTGAGGCSDFIHATWCDLSHGAGLLNDSGTANLVNVTFSGNDAGAGFGAAVGVEFGSVTLVYATIADNTAAGVEGPFNAVFAGTSISPGGGQVRLGRSAVAGVTPICGSFVSSLGANVVSDDTCVWSAAGTGDLPGTDPLLGALADNGGPTRTHLPGAGSPLVDAIAAPACQLLTEDQRGQPRPAGVPCSIGSVEP